jgi:hypothetical protein
MAKSKALVVKKEKVESKVRLYDCGGKAPTENADLVLQQMRLAHQYRNQLVELERKRRAKFYEVLGRAFPEFLALQAKTKEAEARREQAYEALNKARASARKRIEPPDLMDAVKTRKDECLGLYKESQALLKRIIDKDASIWHSTVIAEKNDAERLKDAEAAEFYATWAQDFPSWFEENRQIHEWVTKEEHRLRAESGLYWGTYLLVEESVEKSGPPPRFSSWDGDGHLGVQLQKGLSLEKAFSCKDTRIQINPLPEEEPADFIGPRLSKAARKRTFIRFRIGSTAGVAMPNGKLKGKGKPIFAVVPVTLHTRKEFGGPFPPDAKIKWVHLLRRRIATQYNWSVQFALERSSWNRPDHPQPGSIAIDIGWRATGANGKRRADGSLRVAYWKAVRPSTRKPTLPPECYKFSEDGMEGELVLPRRWVEGMKKVENIQSTRDENLNIACDTLAAWIEGLKEVPGWMGPKIKTIRQWRSKERLADLVVKWRQNRSAADVEPLPASDPLSVHLREQDDKGHLGLKGDEGIYSLMEAWRKRENHLHEYEGNMRDQLQHQREDIYRNFAAWLRRNYCAVKIEDLDLRDFHRLPDIDEPAIDGALKEHVRDACQSLLRRCIQESVANTVEVNPKDTTKKCHKCGSIQEWNHKILRHRCTACGDEWDQDLNAAINIA